MGKAFVGSNRTPSKESAQFRLTRYSRPGIHRFPQLIFPSMGNPHQLSFEQPRVFLKTSGAPAQRVFANRSSASTSSLRLPPRTSTCWAPLLPRSFAVRAGFLRIGAVPSGAVALDASDRSTSCTFAALRHRIRPPCSYQRHPWLRRYDSAILSASPKSSAWPAYHQFRQ